mgnify:FL=1
MVTDDVDVNVGNLILSGFDDRVDDKCALMDINLTNLMITRRISKSEALYKRDELIIYGGFLIKLEKKKKSKC